MPEEGSLPPAPTPPGQDIPPGPLPTPPSSGQNLPPGPPPAPQSPGQNTPPAPPPAPHFTPLGGNQNLPPSFIPQEKVFNSLESAAKVLPNQDGNALAARNIFPDLPEQTKPLGFLMFGVLSFIFLAIVSTLGVVYAIAYDYINVDNPTIERSLTHFVQNFIFMPKTSEYILEKSALAHGKLREHKYAIDLTTGHPTLATALSTTSAVIRITGDADYSDPQDLKSSFVLTGNNLDIDGIIERSGLFFKSRSLPPKYLQYLSLSRNWVRYDLQKYLNDLRIKLSADQQDQSLVDSLSSFITQLLLDKKIVEKTAVSEEKIQDDLTYRLHFDPELNLIDYLGLEIAQKIKYQSPGFRPTNLITDFVLDIWIDQETFLVRKMEIAADIAYQGKQGTASKDRLVIQLAGFHQPTEIQAPTGALDYTQFLSSLSSASPSSTIQTSF